MKKVKKIFAILLALTMALGMGVTTLAASTTLKTQAPTEGKVPSDTDGMPITIQGITQTDATFRAFQIIKAKYNASGFTHYEWAPGTGTDKSGKKIELDAQENVVDLTSDFITDLSNHLEGLDGEKLVEKTPYTPSTPLGAGTWMIIATPNNDVNKVYNPMIASVFYNVAGHSNGLATEELDGTSKWTLESTGAYVKSTDITKENDKQVLGELKDDGTLTEAGAYAAVGTRMGYKITGLIPSYSDQFFDEAKEKQKSVVYALKDSRGDGLKYNNDILVKVVGASGPIASSNYALTWYSDDNFENPMQQYADSAKAFKISFTEAYLKQVAGADESARKIEVTYSATITSDAVKSVAENKYKLEYTRKPGEDATPEDIDTEYTYTFSLDNVIKKVNGDKTVNLPGAEFTIYCDGKPVTIVTDKETGTTGQVATSKDGDEKGQIYIGGLDGDKIYTMKETKAPMGYALNDIEYTIEFPNGNGDRVFDDRTVGDKTVKVLRQYKVKITYKEKDAEGMETTKTALETMVTYGQSAEFETAYPIVNTKLSSLPSTGGIGTTIFTIGGCALMIIAAGLYFATRRKNAK